MGQTKGHVVLYRKYRSRNFDEIVGQEHIVKPLQQAVRSGKIAHAYLFTGPRGTGKTSIARIFAFAINGFDYDDQLPIDIIEIDGASNRRIDEVRELKERIHVAPVQAKFKVYIIDEVHMLTKEAFNALLKTLEEPPEHAVFILATTEVHKLPATIISRTQRYAFRLEPTEVVAKHLQYICEQESIEYDQQALQQIAKLGQGSFRDSISLLDQVSAGGAVTVDGVVNSLGISDDNAISELMSLVETSTPKLIVANLESQLSTGASPTQLAKQLIGHIRDREDINENWLNLIDDLIRVGGSLQPEVSLEVCVLKANLRFNGNAKLAPQANEATAPPKTIAKESAAPLPTVVKETKKDPVKAVEAPKQVAPVKTVKEPSNTDGMTELNDDTWQEITKIVKQKNNALYAVLRMSVAYQDNDKLVLQFKFDFHQKQIAASKNIIADAAQSVMQQELEIVCEVNKNLKPKTSQIEDEQPEPVAAIEPEPVAVPGSAQSVLEAFGGGEVVSL